MMTTLLEIARSKYFCIEPSAFGVLRDTIKANIATRAVYENEEKKMSGMIRFDAKSGKSEGFNAANLWMGNSAGLKNMGQLNDDDAVVNLVRVEGPITRNGDACSYGSKDVRNLMMQAADVKQTIGHIIYCNTPGGSAYSVYDFRDAINYAHSRNQKVYMLCDGDVYSSGAFLSAMCDGVYFVNGNFGIGSIGMYCAFFTLKDGDVNPMSNEVYHEYYAALSTDKNKPYRDAANGDYKQLAKDTDTFLDELLKDIKKDRPSILPEQMTGATYKMKDVIGSLVDGQSSLGELSQMIYNEWSQNNPGTQNTAKDGPSASAKVARDEWSGAEVGRRLNKNTTNSNQNTIVNMNKQFVQVSAFIKAEEVLNRDNEGGLYLQQEQADAIEENLKSVNENVAALNQQIDTLADENTRLKKDAEAQEVNLGQLQKQVEEKDAEIASLKEQLAKSQDDVQVSQQNTADKAELEAKLETANASNTENEKVIGEQKATIDQQSADLQSKDQMIKDLQDTVASLNGQPAPAQSQSPATNGANAEAPKMDEGIGYDTSKTPLQNKAMAEARVKMLKGMK